jgi:hypothetical protein
MATKDDPPVFQRPPNHLNPMFSDIAKLIPFKNAVYGEDLDWTITLYKSKFLESEYQSDPSRIHYHYDLGDRVVHWHEVDRQQVISYEEMLKMIFSPGPTNTSGKVNSQREGGLKLGPRGFVSK